MKSGVGAYEETTAAKSFPPMMTRAGDKAARGLKVFRFDECF